MAAKGGGGGDMQKPRKRQKMNAFAMFMVENRKRWEEEGQAFPAGLKDVASFADPLWRELNEDQRSVYKEMAVAHNTGAPKPGKPLMTTLGFRGPPAPVNVIELSRHGVGVAHQFPVEVQPEGGPANNTAGAAGNNLRRPSPLNAVRNEDNEISGTEESESGTTTGEEYSTTGEEYSTTEHEYEEGEGY